MNGSDLKLLLLLRFEAIEGGKIRDSSGNGNDGTAQGNPQVSADERLGSCLQFDGVHDWVTVPVSSFPAGSTFTISFWALRSLAAPKGGTMVHIDSGTVGPKGYTYEVLVSIDDSLSVIYAPQGQDTFVLMTEPITGDAPVPAWIHWAVTRDETGSLTIYRDGTACQTASSAGTFSAPKAMSLGALTSGTLGLYQGKLAVFRIYEQAQTAVQIAQDINDDQIAVSSFRKSYPIDFGLHNDSEQRVLYITDDAAGHPMHVEIANASGQTIQLVAPNTGAAAGPNNYHFALRFRPGTLSPAFLQGAPAALNSAVQSLNWVAATGRDPDGADSLYFLSAQQMTLQVAQVVKITLPNLSADGAGGARGTRVQLDFGQLKFGDDATPVSGSRISYLSILNQTGAPNAPLHVGFVGNGDILNDGTANTLALRITNTSLDSPITLNPGDAPSKIIITFDVGDETKEWALTTLSLGADVKVAPSSPEDWNQQSAAQGQVPEWILTPKSALALAPGDAINLTLSNIITSLACGQANLFVRYENIPGFWDGERVVSVTKTAMMCNNNGLVGIGTNAPSAKLHVAGDLRVDTAGREAMRIDAKGNVGLNTDNPQTMLHIKSGHFRIDDGEIQSWGPIVIHPDVDKSGDSIVKFVSGGGQETMRVDTSGNVGIGTAAPTSKLTVSSADGHLQLRRERTDPTGTAMTGGSIVYLELAQDDVHPPAVPAVYPNIRFVHENLFWCRIEAQHGPDPSNTIGAFHFMDGPIPSDSYVDVYAKSGHFSGSIYIGDGDFAIYPRSGPTLGVRNHIDTLDLMPSQPGTQQSLKILGQRGGALSTEDCDVLIWKTDTLNSAKGYVQINGTLGADAFIAQTVQTNGNKKFVIPHPSKPGYQLAHACLEGPESAVYYRGEGRLSDGRAMVRLPDYFESLTRKESRTVMLTARGREPFLLSYEDIDRGAFRVNGTKADGEFAWEVKAVRADIGPLEIEVPASRTAGLGGPAEAVSLNNDSEGRPHG